MPRFLDFELDEQQKSSLLQAWMFSHPPVSSPEAHETVQSRTGHLRGNTVQFVSSVDVVCTTGSETPVTIENTANLIFGGVLNYFIESYGPATANVTGAFVCPDDIRPVTLLSEPESEVGFIENERVIAFRPIAPELRRALQSANLRLTPDALRIAAKARGRRLRFEEEPETQSE